MSSATTYYQTNLTTDITYLKGVGPQRGNALKKYGIEKIASQFRRIPRTRPTFGSPTGTCIHQTACRPPPTPYQYIGKYKQYE